MKPRKWKHGTVGTVSHATMRKEDLIPSFTSELRWLGHRSKELTRIERESRKGDSYYESEESDYDLQSLFDMLDSHAPPYMYFGSHPGDGADYGFWISDSLEYDFDGLKVDDLSDVPADYTGEVLEVNDHGNMTLYSAKRGKLTEVWGVV